VRSAGASRVDGFDYSSGSLSFPRRRYNYTGFSKQASCRFSTHDTGSSTTSYLFRTGQSECCSCSIPIFELSVASRSMIYSVRRVAYAPKGKPSPTGVPRNPSFTLSLLLGTSEQHISPQRFSTLNACSSLISLRLVGVQSILQLDRQTPAGYRQQPPTIDERWVSWRSSFPRKTEPQHCYSMAWSWQHASTV
jgi:hypothetical protein